MNTEFEIIAALADGKEWATKLVYEANASIVINALKTKGAAQEDAEDIYQEAMLILYNKAQDEEFRFTCKIGTYLYAISNNLWLKRFDRNKRSPILQTDSEQLMMYAESTLDADMEIFAEREQQFLKLRNAMLQLGDPCAKLLKSFYRKEMTMQEIAQAFGYTNAENAKSQKYKCLARLKKIYTDL